ncbi:MAG: acetate--CoA ligase family protein [Candidatus Azobacteroides sp.]|nr:acetate--CoA ligase family protein [Candidatus Azobacteroides sp.]
MINDQLINPQSIVVVGASNDIHKPGGKIVKNLLDGKYEGRLYAVNYKETEIQGIRSYPNIHDIPDTDLAILAIPAASCPEVTAVLVNRKNVKALIIISAGFGEETPEGAKLEEQILNTVNHAGAALIGPNCIGLITPYHHSVFSRPIPDLHPQGVDLISSSGGTALFIMESAMNKGLRFASVWSVGNAKQIGVEEVLEYMDIHFDIEKDSKLKMLYIESIKNPDKLLKHASSLIKKGCKIAGIKAGSTTSGQRAATSHTGAIANSDSAVEALFRKAGIVRCYSREELTTIACVFTLKKLTGKNIGIVTHAGGPAVLLADALSKGGLNVPFLSGLVADELKSKLFPGAAVGNPIDIIGTGTPEHLGIAIDYCEKRFDNIDEIIVIFGTPGLVKVYEAYRVLDEKMNTSTKPIFPVLPSVTTAEGEVKDFIKKGHVNFSDEVLLGTAITRIMQTAGPTVGEIELDGVNIPEIRRIIDSINQPGYIPPALTQQLLKSAGIPLVKEFVSSDKKEIIDFSKEIGFPVVIKAVGPVHKSDVGGVVLDIKSSRHLEFEFERIMNIPEATAVLIQPMLSGRELFIGAKYENKFGHIVLCGLGGIFVEVLKDIAYGLAPLSYSEAFSMIRSLKSYKIIKGTRGQKGIDENEFAEIIVRLSTLLRFATEIKEIDINPLLATPTGIIAVDARIRIEE